MTREAGKFCPPLWPRAEFFALNALAGKVKTRSVQTVDFSSYILNIRNQVA